MMNTLKPVSNGRMRRGHVVGGAVMAGAVTALAVGTLIATPAAAVPQGVTVASSHSHAHSTQDASASAHAQSASSGRKYYYSATLLGRNEVPEPGKKVNDRDGVAVAKFRISGNRLYYIVQWRRTGKPTAFHIHRGKAGANGPVVIDLLSSGHVHGNTASGSVSVKSSLLRDIKAKPKNWYANLHTAQFPDGAVRGQLHKGSRW